MTIKRLETLFENFKEETLYGRYITNDHIKPLIKSLPKFFKTELLGTSVNGQEIISIEVGKGSKRILMWSQMHGNESTTTKALFDLFHFLGSNETESLRILEACTLKFIPILNPDGAKVYTRVNANGEDLNRDAQSLSQPESIVLRDLFKAFKPHYCFNLHGQRTIFSAGFNNKSATVSFLSPSQDPELSLTNNRKMAMEVISVINDCLQEVIPNQVGIYDDAFNINCVGDTFQSFGVPTILFEAGHYAGDYNREMTREFIFYSYLVSLNYIAADEVAGDNYASYLNIPMNEKLFFDVLIRNAKVENEILDVAIQFQEILKRDKLTFLPKIEKIEKLDSYYGHYDININGAQIKTHDLKPIFVGYENDFVLMNNEKFQLNLIKS